MNAEDARKLARRFIELPLEKRRIFLQGLAREGVDFAQFPIPDQVDVPERAGLSYAQQRMWVLWQLEPHSGAYNLPSAVRLQGALDVRALERAFASLVQRHETLRTVFVQHADDRLEQAPAPHWPQVEHHDLSALAVAEREQRVRALAEQQSLQAFDLAAGPLLRIHLLRLADDEHVLLLTLHHIVSDGWSMNVLIEEFSRLYIAHQQGREAQLGALPIQYSDYALWQRCWLEAGEKQRQLDYWRAQLGEEHPPLELPLDHPRPALPSYRGRRHAFTVDTALAAELNALARAQGVTLFMLLLAAFQVLLLRYSGQCDLRIGVPIANRNRREVEGLIGFFVNTQVLRCQLDPQMSVSQLLAQVKDAALGAQSHQDLPFEQLVEAFAIERSLSHSPLFQVMYNHQPQVADITGLTLADGLQLSPLDWQSRTTQFDLSLDTYEQGGQLRAALTYATDLFDAGTIERMGRHWLALLRGMLADPQQRLEQLPMLSAAEHQQWVVDWNNTGVDYPLQQPLHQLIEAQVERTPEATALLFAEQQLSYRELNLRANRLAHQLLAEGVGPDSLVGIAMERSLEMVVGLLAILKAGAAYVPFDPDYPAERLAYMVEDSGVALVLTQSALLERLPLQAVRVLSLDCLDGQGFADSNPAVTVDPQQLAYVIYTSGSTGRPKGAGNSHAALVNRLLWMQQAYALDASDTVLQKTPFSFDVSVWEFFWPLLTGARLALAAPGEHREPARLIATIQRLNVSTLHFVPSMLQAFIHEAGVEACRGLQRIVCSGEALPLDAQQQVFAKLPQARLYNLYGPTEAAIDVSHWTCVDEGRDSVPIGLPIANLRTYVLDASLMPVPPGVCGELYLGGQGLARGYHRRPALTAERFVVDPLGSGERLYRTGDRVRQREDGVIEYLGRFDHQVKIRGLRIELGEIEARLAQHALVREAVVLAHNGKQLVSYLVLNQAPADWQQQLKDWLLLALPEFMLPTHLLALERLPLTPNGKLDRKALPQPDAVAQAAYVAPQTGVQQQLAAIWQAVLGVEQVGVDDNFFELGGDSIIAIQVVSRARQAGLQFNPRDLFQYQSVRSLATVAGQGAQVKAEQGQVSGAVLLTPIQQAFFEQTMAVRGHWNQSLLLTPRQPLDAAMLREAVLKLVRQHDALRLRFEQGAEGWQQYHADGVDAACFDVRNVRDRDALAALCDEVQRSLDLSRGPLLRAVLLNLDDGSQRLLLVIHHLVVDGVSWRILLEDLQQAYRQQVLPAKTSAWQTWAARLPALADAHEAELDFWQAQTLADTLPVDNRQGDLSNRCGRTLESRFDADLTRQLLQVAPAAYRTQVNDLLLTALARVIARWSGQHAALIELEGHGREEVFDDIDLSRTVGWFTTLFPLRLTPCEGLGDSLKAIKEQLRAVPARGLGFGLLRHLGAPSVRERLASLAAPRITFNYLGQFDREFDEQALWAPAPESSGKAQHEQAPLGNWLTLEGQVYAGELALRWGFSEQMFQPSTIAALASAYEQELRALVEHCCSQSTVQATPSDFPLARIDQAGLDALPVALAELDDLYGLSPMQQGLLFHGLVEQGAGSYINQLQVQIDGLDPQRFRAAWQATLDAHDILRSGFIWQGALDQPVQVVYKHAELPFACHDWRAHAAEETALQALAEEERGRGFDLLRAPLLRVLLLRTGDARYQLIYTHHHVLMDGWSNSQLLGEVLQRYSGQTPTAQPGRYRDYIAWLQRQDASRDQAFWRERLARLDAPTLLAPTIATRVQGSGHGDHYRSLDAAATQRLNSFAREQKVTLNTLVQAAWLLLLQRYSGQQQVCFGATVAGRPADLPGVEQQIGLFINTLPVIAGAAPLLPVRQWLQAVQAENLALREHEHTPLADIQRWAGHAGEALFDSILVFENYPLSDALAQGAPEGLVFGQVRNSEQTHFPLTVLITLGSTLNLQFSYARNAFDPRSVEQLGEQLLGLLEQMSANPEMPVGELDLIGAAARQQQLLEWNRTALDYPLERCIHQQIERRAAANPDALALIDGEQRYSYQQINARANQLAHRLIELGVGPEVRVGVALPRSVQLLTALLAVLKAGGTYVPLDPDYPAERVAYMLEDSQAKVLLTLAQVLEVQAGVQTVHADQFEDYPQHNPETRVCAQNLAYVIYTSGSTGKPKGVAIAHRNVLALIQWTQEVYSQDALQGVLASTSVCFDLSVWELFVTLACGGSLVMARNALALPELPARHLVRLINTVPSAINALARAGQIPDGVRIINLAGEPLKQTLVDTLYQLPSIRHVYDLYGPSEDTTYSTWTRREAGGRAAIGRPLANTAGYVLDAQLQPLPQGLAGELYLAGAGITRGYLLRPGLTAERFVPNPFATDGERMYRSGDLTRYREDGVLEYVGRIDHQVKLRGFRIELGEVEACLLAQPGVREAVVLAVEQQLLGYVVSDDQALSLDALKAALRQRLPEYMVPAQLLRLAQLPLTPNGKLDRKALPQPGNGRDPAAYRAPQRALEQQLAAIWEEVLQVQRVGLDDDFFELGGHSLQLVMLQSRLRSAFATDMQLKDFQGLRRFEDLATYLHSTTSDDGLGAELDLIFGALDELEENNA